MSGESRPELRRRARRHAFLRMVQYRTKDQSGEGHVAVLSAVGMFVRCERLPSIGEPVWVFLEEPTPTLLATGEVRSLREEDDVRGFGLEVSHGTRTFQAIIERLERRGKAP